MVEAKITIALDDAVLTAINNLTTALRGQTAPAPETPAANTGAGGFGLTPDVPVTPVPVSPADPVPVPVVPGVPTAAVPTAAPQYTLEMLATAGSALIDAGKIDELRTVLNKYGVDNLTALPPAQYGAMAMDLRAMGAKL